jgi:hypothetical protein
MDDCFLSPPFHVANKQKSFVVFCRVLFFCVPLRPFPSCIMLLVFFCLFKLPLSIRLIRYSFQYLLYGSSVSLTASSPLNIKKRQNILRTYAHISLLFFFVFFVFFFHNDYYF